MDVRPAIFVREVDPQESVAEVVNEAKALTWTHRAEHALLRLYQGTFVLVRGGADELVAEEVRHIFSLDDHHLFSQRSTSSCSSPLVETPLPPSARARPA